MALIRMNFYSQALQMDTQVQVILPQPRHAAEETHALPTLLLLHGMGDDGSMWLRRTSIERYALDAGLAVVMPDGGLSCYENMVHGQCYRDYIGEELLQLLRRTFPLSAVREENFIAGCSMGGFGALKLGAANPTRWSAIGMLSAAHMEYRPDSVRVRETLWRVYDEDIDGCDERIVADIRRVNLVGPALRIWHAWGDEDMLRGNALRSREFFGSLPEGGVRYHAEELPGRHDWALWDRMVARFIDWLDLPGPLQALC